MSKRATHTRGPWTRTGNTILGNGGTVPVLTSDTIAPADAALIIAAPDMLAELQRLYIKFNYPETGAVIAKATGAAS